MGNEAAERAALIECINCRLQRMDIRKLNIALAFTDGLIEDKEETTC